MINHHWLRIRELRTQIFNCGVSTCSYCRIYVRKCQAKISNSSYVAALFQCRSYPGVSPQRCLAPILAKSYPILWRVWTCQAALRGTIPLHLSREKQGFVRVFCKKYFLNHGYLSCGRHPEWAKWKVSLNFFSISWSLHKSPHILSPRNRPIFYMFREIIYFCEIRWSIMRYSPFTYRGKNEVLLVCFPKIFFPLT